LAFFKRAAIIDNEPAVITWHGIDKLRALNAEKCRMRVRCCIKDRFSKSEDYVSNVLIGEQLKYFHLYLVICNGLI